MLMPLCFFFLSHSVCFFSSIQSFAHSLLFPMFLQFCFSCFVVSVDVVHSFVRSFFFVSRSHSYIFYSKRLVVRS